MRFSEILDGMSTTPTGFSVVVGEDWLQGRSAFGGLQSALAVRAMRRLVPQGMPLRTLQTTFIAPVVAGTVDVQASVLRTGKSAVHVQALLMQGGQTQCIVIGVFGNSRPSKLAITPRQPEIVSPKPIDFRFVAGVTPVFLKHFAVRWLSGGLPFTGATLPENVLEIGMHDTGPTTDAHVLAIADVIPPVGLSLLKSPAPGSSLTWMIEFLRDHFDDLPLQGWRMDAELTAAHDGYTSQTGMLWGPGGEAVALSRQSMVVFG
ncbi:MAG: acyl-CoA thioesterase [Stenotrophobium sp.]